VRSVSIASSCADLGRHRRGDAPRDHQPDQHRAELAHHAEGHDRRHGRLRVEARAAGIDLLGQRRAGEDRGHPDDRQREPAEIRELLEEAAGIIRRREPARQAAEGEDRHPPDRREQPDGHAADGCEETDNGSEDARHTHRR
jgi:hypothetical protein